MTSAILSKPLPYLALIIAHLIWGVNFVVVKITLEEFPPMSLAFLRFALASLFLAPFFLSQTKKIPIAKKDIPRFIAVGILIVTLNITFFFEGMIRTSAINASVLTLIIPALSVLLGWFFLKEKIYLINLVGILVGLLGALIIIEVPQLILGIYSPTILVGNILIILASTFWIIGAIISRGLLKKYPSLSVTAVAFMVGVVTFFIPAAREYFQNPAWPGNISLIGLLGLAFMTLLSSISAYFLFEWGLAKTSVNKADLFQYIEPFIASFLAVLILGEKITPPFLFGSAIIVLGVYLGTLAKEAHHRHKIHRV